MCLWVCVRGWMLTGIVRGGMSRYVIPGWVDGMERLLADSEGWGSAMKGVRRVACV
jgi:hypothetical protein